MSNRNHRIRIITLGCSKNTVDSENLYTQLLHQGFEVELEHGNTRHSPPSTVIINTCGFINDAKQESIDTILAFAEAKKRGQIAQIIVTGCLSQRYEQELKNEIGEVDAFFGTGRLSDILAHLGGALCADIVTKRQVSAPGHYAYVKIAEGCDRRCSFCAIPGIRGRHVSRSPESLVEEVEHLAGAGVKEMILIAQDLCSYGKDLSPRLSLTYLLQRLLKAKTPEWIRLQYLYPSAIIDELLPIIQGEPRVCSYLDIPFQHISDRILHSMRRGHGKKDIILWMENIRKTTPEAAVRTTLITGYPGETEAEFMEMADFITSMRFERLGVFPYSHEEGTFAGTLDDNIPEKEKLARLEHLMEIQQSISLEVNREKIGKSLDVLVDREEGGFLIGRTEADSPEVDNEVVMESDCAHALIGRFAKVIITGAEPFDLYGKPV